MREYNKNKKAFYRLGPPLPAFLKGGKTR